MESTDAHVEDFQRVFGHHVGVRLDLAGHDDLALAERALDDDAIFRPGARIGGERHPGLLVITRGLKNDAQHRCTTSSRPSSLETLVIVSFIPAKDASRPSPPVAEDLTATTAPGPSRRSAASSGSRTALAMPALRTNSCMRLHSSVNAGPSPTFSSAARWLAASSSATPPARIESR